MNTYQVIRVRLDKNFEVITAAKRPVKMAVDQDLNIGGLYFLRKDRLYRVLEKV